MNDWPYHQYVFFELAPEFYRVTPARRLSISQSFVRSLESSADVASLTYATLGYNPGTTFMIWMRAHSPEALQDAVRDILRSPMGEWVTLADTLFGMIRPSQYSRGPQKADQVIRSDERLPYLIIYPFTKTTDWYQLDFETRRDLMGGHIKVGVSHPHIRQTLLYAFGVSDNEFVVSYETPTLPQFQELIIELRSNEVRRYTQNDLPIYTCIYKTSEEFIAWL